MELFFDRNDDVGCKAVFVGRFEDLEALLDYCLSKYLGDDIDILKNNKFWYGFFAGSYPNGYDEELDMSVEEIVGELADNDWWDEFTGYYDEVFEECDGYLDEPRKMEFDVVADKKLTIEFHPGDILYYVNGEVIGSTGPHWKL